MRYIAVQGLLGVALSLISMRASANFAWPPLLYISTYGIWWVVLSGLVVEGIAYSYFLKLDAWKTIKLTLGINLASVLGGLVFTLGSLVPVYVEALMLPYLYISPILIYGITVGIEYFAGTRLFNLQRTKHTFLVISLANIPSVGLAVWQTIVLFGEALHG